VTAIALAAAMAYGTGFALPVPANFHDTEDGPAAAIRRDGGVLLAQQIPPPLPDAYTANVIVTAVKPGELDAARPATCERLSKHWLKDGATLKKQGVVPTPWGPVCQVEVATPKKGKNAASRIVIAAAKGRFSTITCNYDQRDQAAQEACDQVVAGFRMD
jgi:hypothetical protein